MKEAIQEYKRLMNEGMYYESHDVLEAVWLKLEKTAHERDFLKGLIQAAAGLYQIGRNQVQGGLRLLKSSAQYLEPYGDEPCGFDVSRFRQDLIRYYDQVKETPNKIPPVRIKI